MHDGLKGEKETVDAENKVKRLPDEYINTGTGTALAIFKLIEGLAGCIALWYAIMNPKLMEQAARVFYLDLLGSMSVQSAYFTIYDRLFDYLGLIAVFELLLFILEGFAGFRLRRSHKGAGIIRFCHLVRFWSIVLAGILLLVGVVQYVKIMIELEQTARKVSYRDFFGLLGSYQMLIYIVIALGGFSIMADYHRYVGRVMRHVKAETKAGELQAFKKKNRLGREAGWLGGLFVASAVLSVVQIVGGNSIVSIIADIAKPIEVLYSGSGWMNIAITVGLAAKFFLVNRCSADFDRAHQSI